MSWKCPECKAAIDELRYSANTTGREYGTATLVTYTENNPRGNNRIDDYDCNDSDSGDWDGDPEYECPECECNIEINDLVWEDEKEEEEKPKEIELEELSHKIIAPITPCVTNSYRIDTSSMMICKNKQCRHSMIKDDTYGDSLTECPRCGTTTSTFEYNKLLASGYFN